MKFALLLGFVVVVCGYSDDDGFFEARLECPTGAIGRDSVWCSDAVFGWRGPRGVARRAADLEACASETFADQRDWKSQYQDLREAPAVWEKYLLPLTQNAARPLYYLEIGGYDGVAESNTLVLERCGGWRGVLVEGVRDSFRQLRQTRSMAHTVHLIPGCRRHGIAHINHSGTTGANLVAADNTHAEPVHCGPLIDLLVQLAVPRIDFWSLDVENTEELVLRTMDFSRIAVRYLMVEVHNRFHNTTKQRWLSEEFAPANGFRLVDKIGASWLFEGARAD